MGGLRTMRRSAGVALITALLVVALATAAAVAMASRELLEVRRTANVLQGDQATVFLLGVEDWAREVLRRDRQDGERDTLNEDWATLLPPVTVDGGAVLGHIEDMQGRFNLNSLVDAEGKPVATAVARFRHLLSAVGLEPDLANAVVDWIDPDIEPQFPGGAEDDVYLRAEPPYRAANAPMASASELRLVAGFDAESYAAIAPDVTALPDANSSINVNTAPAPVLQSLAEGLSAEDAEALVAARGDDGFGSLNEFLALEPLAGREVDSGTLSTGSRYFALVAEARIGTARATLFSRLKRDDSGQVSVLGRSRVGL